MYNGLNCPIPHNITMYNKNDKTNEIMFNFNDKNIDHIEHLNAGPDGVKWVVKEIPEFDCGGLKFSKPEFEFIKTSPPAKIGAESEYADRAQHVLLTWSFEHMNAHNEGEPVELDIVESTYRDRLEKSDTGLPYVRYINIKLSFGKSNQRILILIEHGGLLSEKKVQFRKATPVC